MADHSIFNDVLGPVMAGPSSSHSAGCARIGRMTRLLAGGEIQKAVVVYDSQGSYPSTCVGQGSNFGFTGGLIGLAGDDPRMKDSIVIAKEVGVDISFAEETLSARHPNEARIDVYDGQGNVDFSVLTLSVGGGMFQIVELDGFPVYMDGSKELIYVYCNAAEVEDIKEKLETVFGNVQVSDTSSHEAMEDVCLICAGEQRKKMVPSANEDCQFEPELERNALLEELETCTGVHKIRTAGIVLPIPMKTVERAIFSTAEEALQYAEQLTAADAMKEADGDEKAEHAEITECTKKTKGLRMWELAVEYECSLGEVTPEDVWKQAEHTLQVMRNAATPPETEKTEQFGFLPYQCADMKKRAQETKLVNTGYLEKAMFYALAVMENSCAHNIVTASPTAGSSGVVPAAVVAVGEEMGCSDDEIAKGLLAAGLAGAFIANQATFGAEVAGCQAENGAASAMAAAGVVELLGGTAEQGMKAASLALQNMLGLICDPVGGLTEIPCISRNVAAMSNAVMSANMIMLGFDPVIPYDETILTMYEVGKQLPSALRCTCEGGLCATKTGQRLAAQLK